MKRTKKLPSHSDIFSSGASLGGKVSHYRDRQNVYSQGTPANTVFYIQEGWVRLSTHAKNRPPAVTDILSAGDFFGSQCLAGFPLRESTAVTMASSSIWAIQKHEMISLLHKKHKVSNSLVSYLLESAKRKQDHVAELLTFPAEQRLARVLLRLAHLDRTGPPILEVPILSHQVLSEMVGTTRSRINFFMNDFRRRGYISYDGGLEVHKSLNKVLRNK